jgi:hypothetical protein
MIAEHSELERRAEITDDVADEVGGSARLGFQ